ncbi:MAG TPA: hypothetical protein VIT65_25510 [Microlunatus sp.]
MAAGQLARELGVPKRTLVTSLIRVGLCDPGGVATVKAINWGYARLTGLTEVTAGTQVARWHTRRCMRLVKQEPPGGREWDLLLMAEEVDDVIDECARLEASGNVEGIYGVLATLDDTVCSEVRTRLHAPVTEVVAIHRRA